MSLLCVGRLLRGDCHRVALRQAGTSAWFGLLGKPQTLNPKPPLGCWGNSLRAAGGGGAFDVGFRFRCNGLRAFDLLGITGPHEA